MRPCRLPLVLCTALFIAGCSIPAHRLEVSAVKRITPGKTRRAEVEEIFGRAKEVNSAPTDFVVANYFFREVIPSRDANPYERRLKPADVLVRSLSLRYDTNGVVVQKLHDESFTPVRRSVTGWFETGPLLDRNVVAATIHSNAPSSEIIKYLNEPIARWLTPNGNTVLEWLYLKDRNDRLGRPEGSSLRVLVDGNNRVLSYWLAEFDPREWFLF
jgi:hypothetical protein